MLLLMPMLCARPRPAHHAAGQRNQNGFYYHSLTYNQRSIWPARVGPKCSQAMARDSYWQIIADIFAYRGRQRHKYIDNILICQGYIFYLLSNNSREFKLGLTRQDIGKLVKKVSFMSYEILLYIDGSIKVQVVLYLYLYHLL